MHLPPQIRTLLLTACVVLGAGCAPSRRGGQTVNDGGVPRDAMIPVQTDCTDISPAALPGQPCCLALGIDACGANTICAALDGRSVPVCYAEGSRTWGETCTAAVGGASLCSSGLTCRASSDGETRCLEAPGTRDSGQSCFDGSECSAGRECTGSSTNSNRICQRPLTETGAACTNANATELCPDIFRDFADVVAEICVTTTSSGCHDSFARPEPGQTGVCAFLGHSTDCASGVCGDLACTETRNSFVLCHIAPFCPQ